MRRTWLLLLLPLILILAAPPAEAVRCSSWTRMSYAARDQTLDRMIQNALSSPEARRQRRVNLARVERCLVDFKPEIELDFDAACAQGQRRDLRVLNNIFRTYIWSCV